jgi:four helix bundle protein
MQDFKTIKAWRRGLTLAIAVHGLARAFSRKGHAHLRSQLTRAADSISTNIVEGCGAASNKEFARYLDVSIKSANETEHHLRMARDLNLIPHDEWQRHTAETIEVRKMIFGYRAKLLQDP